MSRKSSKRGTDQVFISAPELSIAENTFIKSALNDKENSLFTTVIQLFKSTPPNNSWTKLDTGVLCLIKDYNLRSYFCCLYNLYEKQPLWKQELYQGITFIQLTEYLVSFEGERAIIGLNFLNSELAQKFITLAVSKALGRSRVRRSSIVPSEPPPLPSRGIPNTPPYHTSRPGDTKSFPKVLENPKPGQRKKITKDDIGKPTEFRIITTYDLARIENMLQKCGIPKSYLKESNTKEFIIGVIDSYNAELQQKPGAGIISNPMSNNSLFPPIAQKPQLPNKPIRLAPSHPTSPAPELKLPVKTKSYIKDSLPPAPPPPPQQFERQESTIKRNEFSDTNTSRRTPSPVNPRNELMKSLTEKHILKPVGDLPLNEKSTLPQSVDGSIANVLLSVLDKIRQDVQDSDNEEDNHSDDSEW